MISLDMPRNTPKNYYKALRRMMRCMYRAQQESGNYAKLLNDMIIYGQGFYTPEQQAEDQARASELMAGLKPKLN